MKQKIISIRLSLDKLTDQKIDNILSRLHLRRKSEYIRNAIVSYNNFEHLLELIKQALIEVLDERETIQAGVKNETEGGFDDYLQSL